MTEPTQSALAAGLAQLVGAVPTIRAAIRRRSESCWAEHLSIVTLRFRSNLKWSPDVEALRKVADQLVCYAGERDALECLRVLHERDCSFLHVGRPGGGSLLHAAARRGSARTLSWLIDAQALPVNQQGRGGATALHFACMRGHGEIVSSLLARRAFIDAPDDSGETPLHAAVRAGWHRICEALIDAGANLGATSRYGQTALTVAVQRASLNFDWKLVALLLDRGAALTHALPTLLRWAPEGITRHPLIPVARLETCEQDQLGRLFETASPRQAQALLERGADPTIASVHALRNAQYDLLSVIRAHHPFPYTSAHYHAALESLHGMTRLLDQGGDPNAIIEHRYGDERHALIQYAAGGGDIATIPVLLQRGARTSAAPERLEDPFLVVLVRHERASPEVISAYVQQGHDINARTSAGRTALHELAYQPWCDRVASTLHTLLRAGADIDARDADGHTPLMECVRAYCTRPDKNPDKIAAWLAAQASVNAIDAKGKSVLHHFFGACINRGINGTDHSDHHYQAALELLLSRGADMDATTSTGLYPEESGDPKTVPDLRDALRRLRGRRTLAEAARPDDLAGTTESQPPQNAATGQQQRSMAMGRHPRKLSH